MFDDIRGGCVINRIFLMFCCVAMSVEGRGGEITTFQASVPEKRALLDFTSSEIGLHRQDIFDQDTFISVATKDASDTTSFNSKSNKLKSGVSVSGRPKQAKRDWLSFLAAPPTGVVLEKLKIGAEVVDLSVLPVDQAIPKNVRAFEYSMVRDAEAGNAIVKFNADLTATPNPKQSTPTVISCSLIVHEFQKQSGVFVPVDFTHMVKHGIWVPADPPNANKPKVRDPVPPTFYTTRFRLSDVVVNGPIDATAFRANIEDGHPAINLDARHIRHVLVSNKILPE